MQVKKQQLEPDKEKGTGFKQGKEYIKAVYCYPAYLLTHMQSTSHKMPGWNKDKLVIKTAAKISITSDMQTTPPCRKQRETEEPLDQSESGDRKTWLKTQHSEN